MTRLVLPHYIIDILLHHIINKHIGIFEKTLMYLKRILTIPEIAAYQTYNIIGINSPTNFSRTFL